MSTDSEEIAAISKQHGAEVPFMRPDYLASDKATSIDAIIHALDFLKDKEQYTPDYIILLQPTSPLRTTESIDDAITRIIEKEAETLVSIMKLEKSPFVFFKKENDKIKRLIEPEDNTKTRRQDTELYELNGAIYISKPDNLYRTKNFINSDTIYYTMSQKESVDIDNMLDWEFAECILKRKG